MQFVEPLFKEGACLAPVEDADVVEHNDTGKFVRRDFAGFDGQPALLQHSAKVIQQPVGQDARE